MVNVVKFYVSMLHKMMKLAGMQPIEVEIEPGTVIHFWVNTNNNDNDNNNKKKNKKEKKEKKKKKPPVVLIHGFAGDGILTWQFQVLALRKKYSLYIPDLLFFGGSHTSKTDEKITPKFMADCFAKGLRKLMGEVEEKCVVVGFSYGGFVGFKMAEHHPDLVGSVVVTGAVLDMSQSISDEGLKRIGFSSWPDLLMPNTVEGVKVLLDTGSYKFPWMPNLFYRHYFQIMFDNRMERVELLEAQTIKDEDVTNHQFEQSIHLLWGNEDKIFDLEVAKSLKEKLGDKAELQVVKKAGHLALLERPFAFNKRLLEMLQHSHAIASKHTSC